jgi:hypothetical protein
MGVPPQAFRTHGAFGPPPRLPRRPE